MPRADTLAYANTLLDGLGNTTQMGAYYFDIVMEIARGKWTDVVSLVDADWQQTFAGVGVYSFPTDAIRVISVHFDAKALAEATPSEASSYDPSWRQTGGEPLAFVSAGETFRDLRLAPIPQSDSADPGGDTPFDWIAWPSSALTMIYTKVENDVHLDEELWIALEVVARELARDSNHHDAGASDIARNLAEVFRKLSHAVQE